MEPLLPNLISHWIDLHPVFATWHLMEPIYMVEMKSLFIKLILPMEPSRSYLKMTLARPLQLWPGCLCLMHFTAKTREATSLNLTWMAICLKAFL
jgi:hypothetical protein